MKHIVLILAVFLVLSLPSKAQQEESDPIATNAKTGLIPGGVPAIAYDEDKGFLYGVILNFSTTGTVPGIPGMTIPSILSGHKPQREAGKIFLDMIQTG